MSKPSEYGLRKRFCTHRGTKKEIELLVLYLQTNLMDLARTENALGS